MYIYKNLKIEIIQIYYFVFRNLYYMVNLYIYLALNNKCIKSYL